MNLKEEIRLQSGIYEEIDAQKKFLARNWGPGYKVYVDNERNDHRIFIQPVNAKGDPNGEVIIKVKPEDALGYLATKDGDKNNSTASMIVSGGKVLTLDINAGDSVTKFISELNKAAILVPSRDITQKTQAKLTET